MMMLDAVLSVKVGGTVSSIPRPSKSDLLHWKGILGASIIDDRIRVGLTVFVYSGSERLVTKTGKEFADFVYEMDEDRRGEWKLFGWFEDTYGEYSQY